uniref:Uncharacterized protein n=1 Tax=Anguilla anguilla TaxID=7936 RepID=A0A0E9XNA7_ANGAN
MLENGGFWPRPLTGFFFVHFHAAMFKKIVLFKKIFFEAEYQQLQRHYLQCSAAVSLWAVFVLDSVCIVSI